MSVTLAVHMPLDSLKYLTGKGYRSSDRYAKQVECFCMNHGLPYSALFVSITIYLDTEVSCGLAGVFGHATVILRNDSVLSDVMIASSEDFQNVAYNGYHNEQMGHSVTPYLNKISNLAKEVSIACKVAALRRVVQARQGTDYVEARVFRPLTANDVQVVLDISGNEIPRRVWST